MFHTVLYFYNLLKKHVLINKKKKLKEDGIVI